MTVWTGWFKGHLMKETKSRRQTRVEKESVQERKKERQAGRRTIKDLVKREKKQKLYGREGSIMYT